MEWSNETTCAAELFRSEFREDRMYCAAVIRRRYVLREYKWESRWRIEPASRDRCIDDIRRDRQVTDYGVLEPDVIHPRTGTDLIVLGDAVAPRGPVTSMSVQVRAGPYDLTALVVGDRIWKRPWGSTTYRPGVPSGFDRIPITWKNAFGGECTTPYGALPWSANPLGRGFVMDENSVEGMPLPNVEDPKSPISTWTDHPDPVGFAPYPLSWSLRLNRVMLADPDGSFRINHQAGIHDRAYPSLSGRKLECGIPVEIFGMTSSGYISFMIPPCPVSVEVRLGDFHASRTPALEEVLVDLRPGLPDPTVDFTWRKVFDYAIISHQQRTTEVRWVGGTS